MEIREFLTLFTAYDVASVLFVLAAWIAIGWRIEHPGRQRPSVSTIMCGYRREWMRQMITRKPRIFDSQLLSTLRQGTSFFGSATMIAIGGVMALIGNSDPLGSIARTLGAGSTPALVWETKLLLMLFFLLNAYLKFVWSHRLFGYCAVLMGAVPNEPEDPHAAEDARKAAELNITAAQSFNRGIRAVYFALASAAWALGPVFLVAATIITCAILWHREFMSHSRRVMLEGASRLPGPPGV